MREISLDLSNDKCQKIFAGYAGEHNATTLTVTLPTRMVSENYTYVAEFGTPLGDKYTTTELTLDENSVSVDLTNQVTVQGEVQFQVIASETDGQTLVVRGKTVTALLVIKPSVDGVDSEYDPEEEASVREELHSDYYNKTASDARFAKETELSDKLDKVTTANQVYCTNANGEQTTRGITSSATPLAVPIRDAQGRISVGTPESDDHASPKKYVDDTIATALAALSTKTVTVNYTDGTSESFNIVVRSGS